MPGKGGSTCSQRKDLETKDPKDVKEKKAQKIITVGIVGIFRCSCTLVFHDLTYKNHIFRKYTSFS